MKKFIAFAIIIILVVGVSDAGAFYWYQKQYQKQQQRFNGQINALQRQISGLQTKLALVGDQSASAALSAQEVSNRQPVYQKSQEDLVTAAVAKASPAVVSIIISQDVPQYKVVYVNPFGDDPFFQNSGIQVPEYGPPAKPSPRKWGRAAALLLHRTDIF